MNNTLEIQQYQEQIAVLDAKIAAIMAREVASRSPGLYVCTRCGSMYQSVWGCGCAREATDDRKLEVSQNMTALIGEIRGLCDEPIGRKSGGVQMRYLRSKVRQLLMMLEGWNG